MTTNESQVHTPTVNSIAQSQAATGLALIRVTIGAMFVWVFFENLGKGGYPPAGYACVINYYIKKPRTDSNRLARDLRTEVSL